MRLAVGALSGSERELAADVVRRVHQPLLTQDDAALEEVIGETLFHEQARLEHSRHPRAKSDRAFYARVRKELRSAGNGTHRRLLCEIIQRYADEISGHFDPRVYNVATRALPVGLSVLMHSVDPRDLFRGLPRLPDLSGVADRLLFEGEVDALLSLSERGTVVLAPTHSSNLDSVLMGFAIYQLGLPPFVYGAGLNLFSNRLIGFFMHNLGAYTVDRLKTDPLYRQTLKAYATASLELGQHNLYFPGGTRSRSGGVERHLKKGLLGTSLEAFRNNLIHRREHPRIFVVPCTCTYPLVLEAETLIRDQLQSEGRGRYIIEDDEFSLLNKWVAFLRGILRLDLRIRVVIGRPLDPFGNTVDAQGRSYDGRGREIDPGLYLMERGQFVPDEARDQEYTRFLASRLVETYHRDTVALPTQVVAYAVLELLRRQKPRFHLYRLLRSQGPETALPIGDVEAAVGQIRGELLAQAQTGAIRLGSEVLQFGPAEIVDQACRTLAAYHPTPVLRREGAQLFVGDAELVFYYRNRLDGRGLLGAPSFLPASRFA